MVEKLEHLSALRSFIFFFIYMLVFGRSHEHSKFQDIPGFLRAFYTAVLEKPPEE